MKRHEAAGMCAELRNPWCEPGRDEGRREVRPHRVLEARQKLLDSAEGIAWKSFVLFCFFNFLAIPQSM